MLECIENSLPPLSFSKTLSRQLQFLELTGWRGWEHPLSPYLPLLCLVSFYFIYFICFCRFFIPIKSGIKFKFLWWSSPSMHHTRELPSCRSSYSPKIVPTGVARNPHPWEKRPKLAGLSRPFRQLFSGFQPHAPRQRVSQLPFFMTT